MHVTFSLTFSFDFLIYVEKKENLINFILFLNSAYGWGINSVTEFPLPSISAKQNNAKNLRGVGLGYGGVGGNAPLNTNN